jgi:hypothetical protein
MNEQKEIFIEQLIKDEKAGKNMAIHAYDKMMWTVRSGYLTLVFGGWGFIIKSAIEKGVSLEFIKPYVLLLSGFTLALSIGAYLIDRNYAKRKFRVIKAVNNLVQMMMSEDMNNLKAEKREKLLELLQISGDAANDSYKMQAFTNEMHVGRTIYLLPVLLLIIILTYYLLIL